MMKRAHYLLISFSILVVLASEASALTVEQYYQLTLDILRASVDETDARMAAATQHAKNPSEYVAAVQAIETNHANRREELYGKYGSSKAEYLSFGRTHYLAVESYLEHHDEIRRELEAVRSEAMSRREQLESAIMSTGLHKALPQQPGRRAR